MNSPIKVGLIGFGKTGRAVANVLLENTEIDLCWVVRRSTSLEHHLVGEFLGINPQTGNQALIYSKNEFSAKELIQKFPVQVIVDFSSNEGVDYYGQVAADNKITIISAISAYSPEKIELLKILAQETVVLHSPNITIGINFLIVAAKILKNIAPYTDIEITEEHFKAKTETSGTAKIIAKELDIEIDKIKSLRAGGIIGVHNILFGFPYQTIRLKHESISREAFGDGVVFAIKNLQGKEIGFYSLEKLLLPYFKIQESEEELIKSKRKPWWKILF